MVVEFGVWVGTCGGIEERNPPPTQGGVKWAVRDLFLTVSGLRLQYGSARGSMCFSLDSIPYKQSSFVTRSGFCIHKSNVAALALNAPAKSYTTCDGLCNDCVSIISFIKRVIIEVWKIFLNYGYLLQGRMIVCEANPGLRCDKLVSALTWLNRHLRIRNKIV